MFFPSINIYPNRQSLEPELLIGFEYVLNDSRSVAIQAYGHLSINGTKIAEMRLRSDEHADMRDIGIKVLPRDQAIAKGRDRLSFTASLSQRALDWIQECRERDVKHDVRLQISLTTFSISSRAYELSIPLQVGKNQTENAIIPQMIDSSIINVEKYVASEQYVIPSNDWIKDYCPVFKLGKFMVIEVPQVEPGGNILDIHERINRATEVFHRMQGYYLNGEWTNLIEESRKFWEAFNIGDVTNLIDKDPSDPEADATFKEIIKNFFALSSKYVHIIDQSKKIRKTLKADKEDAILVFMIAASVLNLISSKQAKLDKADK
jgi:hypothetical protein